jgi:hypothetical protein
MFNEKQGPPMYCRFRPTVAALIDLWAGRWGCHKHEAINRLVFVGAMCSTCVTNISIQADEGQPGTRTEDLTRFPEVLRTA